MGWHFIELLNGCTLKERMDEYETKVTIYLLLIEIVCEVKWIRDLSTFLTRCDYPLEDVFRKTIDSYEDLAYVNHICIHTFIAW